MVGEVGLQEELEMVGLRVVKEATRPPAGMTEDEFRENDHDPEVSVCLCVAVSFAGFVSCRMVVLVANIPGSRYGRHRVSVQVVCLSSIVVRALVVVLPQTLRLRRLGRWCVRDFSLFRS